MISYYEYINANFQVPRIQSVEEYTPVVFLALLVIVVTLEPYILGYILK